MIEINKTVVSSDEPRQASLLQVQNSAILCFDGLPPFGIIGVCKAPRCYLKLFKLTTCLENEADTSHSDAGRASPQDVEAVGFLRHVVHPKVSDFVGGGELKNL